MVITGTQDVKTRSGSVANECTETSTPERTKNVPRDSRRSEDREQQCPALEDAALLRDGERVDQGVPTSQGMKEAFSTGSQNHHPPSRARNKPTSFQARCRWSGISMRRSSTAGSISPCLIESPFEHGGAGEGERNGEST